MPGSIIVVMKSDYDYGEKEYEDKKKCYSLAAQY
jgi:hypothetical protein